MLVVQTKRVSISFFGIYRRSSPPLKFALFPLPFSPFPPYMRVFLPPPPVFSLNFPLDLLLLLSLLLSRLSAPLFVFPKSERCMSKPLSNTAFQFIATLPLSAYAFFTVSRCSRPFRSGVCGSPFWKKSDFSLFRYRFFIFSAPQAASPLHQTSRARLFCSRKSDLSFILILVFLLPPVQVLLSFPS